MHSDSIPNHRKPARNLRAAPYDAVVLLAIVAVLAVTVARLAIWSKHPRSRVLTVGMLAIGVAFLAAQPVADDTIDTWIPTVANVSELLHSLLIVLAGWAYGVIGLRALDLAPPTRWWTGLAAATAAAMVVLWVVGDLSRTPTATVAEIRDPTVAPLTILYCCWVATACALVVASAVDALRRGSTGIRWLLAGMLAGGGMGLGYVLTMVTLLLVAPDVVREHAYAIQSAWAAPGLIFLAVAGLPGFLTPRMRQ